jgi:hypothetical protein
MKIIELNDKKGRTRYLVKKRILWFYWLTLKSFESKNKADLFVARRLN